jgi:hypothetical protein
VNSASQGRTEGTGSRNTDALDRLEIGL